MRLTWISEDREFIVLVGPSGCRKSTTLRMVAGLEDFGQGDPKIGGATGEQCAPEKTATLRWCFRIIAYIHHMSVYKEHGDLDCNGGRWNDQGCRSRRAGDGGGAGFGDYGLSLERKPKALSGGQRQRVAVGRAIVRDPKAFLFDEPLSNLDAKLRVETRAEIKKLPAAPRRHDLIYMTHDQEEAMTLGDRIVVMKDGFIQQCAPANWRFYDRPVNRVVASFCGDAADEFH